MRTFGFAPHIFCGVDRNVLTTTGFPYPNLAYYHQQDPCISPHNPYSDLHSAVDFRRYMPRFDYGSASVAALSNPLYHCSCNGPHSLSSQAATSSILPHQLPFSYSCDSKRYPTAKNDESTEEEQRMSSIVTLRNKAKEYEINNLKIKPEYEERERPSHAV